jgi:hypothetical protein
LVAISDDESVDDPAAVKSTHGVGKNGLTGEGRKNFVRHGIRHALPATRGEENGRRATHAMMRAIKNMRLGSGEFC